MRWSEIQERLPNQWLIIEALEAHTTEDSIRTLDRISVVELCADGNDAFQCYRQLHRQFPSRELLFVHTSREELRFRERFWFGIRPGREIPPRPAREVIKGNDVADLLQTGHEYEVWSPYDAGGAVEIALEILNDKVESKL